MLPKSPSLRLRTETVPSSTSLSPITSIYGIFSNCASRILYPTFSLLVSQDTRIPALLNCSFYLNLLFIKDRCERHTFLVSDLLYTRLHIMPLSYAFPAAGSCCMLCNKYRMPFHRSLFPIIGYYRWGFPFH